MDSGALPATSDKGNKEIVKSLLLFANALVGGNTDKSKDQQVSGKAHGESKQLVVSKGTLWRGKLGGLKPRHVLHGDGCRCIVTKARRTALARITHVHLAPNTLVHKDGVLKGRGRAKAPHQGLAKVVPDKPAGGVHGAVSASGRAHKVVVEVASRRIRLPTHVNSP